jgi:hypothetical protein
MMPIFASTYANTGSSKCDTTAEDDLVQGINIIIQCRHVFISTNRSQGKIGEEIKGKRGQQEIPKSSAGKETDRHPENTSPGIL